MKECAVLLAVFSAFTVSINSALADTFGSGGQRVHHRLGRYRRRREQASSTSPVKKQMPGINIMTKIRAARLACACLLAFYLPSTSHATQVMVSPSTQSGGVVDFRGSSSDVTTIAVAFTSMTPILLEFYGPARSDRLLSLRFESGSGAPGISNLTGVPWAGIEFRTPSKPAFIHDPAIRDDYIYFENSSQEWLDDVFSARTRPEGALVAYGANLQRYGGTIAYTDLTDGLYMTIPSEYPLLQHEDNLWTLSDMYKIDSDLQDIARINFAPGKPESSGISGEMLLYGAGSSGLWGGNETDGYSHILITPIAASVPVEPFVITNITRSGNTAELRWQPLPNNTPVRVERTTDLSGPWTAIATNLISGSFTGTTAPTRSAFYRLATEP